MKEIWKDISEYKGLYKVSNTGRVKSLEKEVRNRSGFRKVKEKILKGGLNSRGYLTVCLSKNGVPKTYKVHKLVAKVFLDHKPCGMKLFVDHINGIRTDNRLENLQIVTARENCFKDQKCGTSKYLGVCWHKVIKKWMSQIKINRKSKHLGTFENEIDAHNAYQEALRKLV